jgi:uncharacterized protein (DUF169 family)
MEWTKYADEIRELLGLEGSAVAITYSMDAAPNALKGKHRVCDALIKARDGATIDLTASTSACGGGTSSLGLGERPKPGTEEDRSLKDFLVNGEKLYCSVATFYRSQALSSPPPFGMAEHVILEPLGQAKRRPDAILFICNAEQASRLVQLDMYDTGIPPKVELSGATCHQAVAYPVSTGELNVSFMDFTSRHIKKFKPSDLLVTVPYHRFLGIMRSIDHCTAGRARIEVAPSMRRRMDPSALSDLEC